MWRSAALAVLAMLASPAAHAGPCEDAARRAEQASGLPPGLLKAIGHVESGRKGASGALEGWPFAVGEASGGQLLGSAELALAHARARLAAGVRSIDVGCFQVNLQHHPSAFARLEDAFDPDQNAAYAARFLRDLQGRLGSWKAAAAAYHSSTPEVGAPYLQKVIAAMGVGSAPIAARNVTPPMPEASGPRVISFVASRPGQPAMPVIIRGGPGWPASRF